jgi:branched-chain amino acid transport system substrate-binding protein
MMSVYRRSLLLLALTACSHTKAGTVVFGAAGPWNEPYGDANKKGIELAVDEINASPAWSKDRHLEIVFANDSGNGVRASAVAQQFVDSTPIVAVVGHVNSGAMVSAAHVYDKQLAAVATTATSPSLTGISPWAFRVITSDSANGLTIARFADKLGRKRAAVLYENNPYGRGLADNFRKSFHGQIISIDPIAEGEGNFEVFVSWYKSSHPDLVFVAGTDGSGIAFLKEARRQQLTADLVGGDGWQTLAPNALAEGIYVGAPFSAQDPRPEVQAFVAAYKRRYNTIPDGNAALAYDATKLLATAVARVGANRVKIRDYLANLSTRDQFGGVTGTIRFGSDGDPIGKRFVMTRVRQGALLVESNQ